ASARSARPAATQGRGMRRAPRPARPPGPRRTRAAAAAAARPWPRSDFLRSSSSLRIATPAYGEKAVAVIAMGPQAHHPALACRLVARPARPGGRFETRGHPGVLLVQQAAGRVHEGATGLHESRRRREDVVLLPRQALDVCRPDAPLEVRIAAQGSGAAARRVHEHEVGAAREAVEPAVALG